MKHVNLIFTFFLISYFSLLPLISQAQSSSLPSNDNDQSLPPENGEGNSESDTVHPAAPDSSPIIMSDSDGGDPDSIITSDDPLSPAGAPGPEPDIPNLAKTCQAKDNSGLCSESVKSGGVSLEVIEMEIRTTQEATQKALSLTINPKNPDMDTLKHCKDVYIDALSNLQEALDLIPKKDIEGLKTKLSAAMTDLDTCDEGFAEQNEVSPMAESGGKLNKMVSDCLSRVSTIRLGSN